MSQKLPSDVDRLVVYYDGACPVCSTEIAYYQRQRGAEACQWIDASACAESELGPDLTRDVALRRFHVRRVDGKLVSGMHGFATLWRALPRTAWLGRIASFGPMPVLLDGAYQSFLAIRVLWRPRTPASKTAAHQRTALTRLGAAVRTALNRRL